MRVNGRLGGLVLISFIFAFSTLAWSQSQRDMVCQGSCGGGCGPCPMMNRSPVPAGPSPEQIEAERVQSLTKNTNAGIAAFHRGDYESAVMYFQEALKFSKYQPVLLQNLHKAQNALLEQKAAAATRSAAVLPSKAQRAPTVSPSMFITEAEYKSAQNNLARLQKQRDALTEQLAKVKEWAAGLRKDDNEFEQMRQEARKNLAWEFLDHVPVSEGLDALKGKPALQKLNLEQIKKAYNAVKGLLETGRGISTKDDREKIENILAGNRALQAAGIDVLALDDKSRKLYEAVSKIVTYGGTLAANAGTSDGTNRDNLKTVMTLVEILEPWAGAGVLLESGFERGTQWYAAGKALDSLREAESSNWNAQNYLTQRIEQLNIQAKEVGLTIEKHDIAVGQR
jgi:hypothetical protein